VVRANVLARAIFSKSLDLFSPFFLVTKWISLSVNVVIRLCIYLRLTHLRAGSWHRWLSSVHPFGEQQQQIRKKKRENTNRHPMAVYFFILSSMSFST
jgi:hypothetical protein